MSGFYDDDPFADPFFANLAPAVPSQPQPPVLAPVLSPYQQAPAVASPSYQGGVSLVGNKDAYLSAISGAPPNSSAFSAPTPVGGPAMLPNPFTSAVSSPLPPMPMPGPGPGPGPMAVQSPVMYSGTSGFNPVAPTPSGMLSPALAPLVASPAPVPVSVVSSPVPPTPNVVVQEDDFGISWNQTHTNTGASSALKSHGPPPAPAPPAPRPATVPPVPPRSPVSVASPQPSSSIPIPIPTTTTSPTTPPQPQVVSKPPEGMLLARLSTRAIFVREWKPCFWIIINQRLWLYRSKADFDPNDYIHNPFNDRIKKQILIRDCLRITDVKSKVYPGESQTLYTFNVEDSEEDGAKMVLAKFAAYDWDQIRALHEELHRRVADLTRAKRGGK